MLSTNAPARGTSSSHSSSSAHSSDEHYYTNEEVRILHHVVSRAQVIFEQLPESERIATNALWKACDELSDETGVNYFDQSRPMSKIIFYIGGQRGPGTLLDKFRDVMWRRHGIELEIRNSDGEDDDDSDGDGRKGKGRARDDEDNKRKGKRDDTDDSDDSDDGYEWENKRHRRSSRPPPPPPPPPETAGQKFARFLGFGGSRDALDARPRTATQPTSSASETDDSPHSLESLQGHRVASDTTAHDFSGPYGRGGGGHSSTGTYPPPQQPPFHPPSALKPMPVDYSLPDRLKTKKTVTFQSPSLSPESTKSAWHDDERSDEDDDYDDEEIDPHPQQQYSIPEPDPIEQEARERRAGRAHLIYLTQNVLHRWCMFAGERAERTAVARRHMLRYKYFGAWRSVADPDVSEDGSSVTDVDVSHDLSNPDMAMPSWPPANVDPDRHWAFLEKTAREWGDGRVGRTVLDQWRVCAPMDSRLEDPYFVACNVGAADCLEAWRGMASAKDELAEQAAERFLMGQTFARWRPEVHTQDEALADAQFSRWLHGSVAQRSREFIQSAPSPNGTLTRHIRSESPPHDPYSADPARVAQSVAMFENIIASRCLTLWVAMLYYIHEDMIQVQDYRASIAAWVAINTWDMSQAQHRMWEAWALRGDWYLSTTRVFDRWCGPSAIARKRREREVFAHLKKSRRARLAKRSLRVWTDLVGQADDDEALAAQYLANGDWALADEAADFWFEWREQQDDDAHTLAALDLFERQALTTWIDSHDDALAATTLATNAWGEQAKSQCLTRWTLAQLQINGRQHMVEDAREQNDRKMFRNCFEGWEDTVLRPGQTPGKTPGTARRRMWGRRVVPVLAEPRNLGSIIPTQGPRTPWTAPALPIRSRHVDRFPRRPTTMVAFEAGDPDEEDDTVHAHAMPPPPRVLSRRPLPEDQAANTATTATTAPSASATSVFSRSVGVGPGTSLSLATAGTGSTATPRTPAVGGGVFGGRSGLRRR